jgi:hypothetical protein
VDSFSYQDTQSVPYLIPNEQEINLHNVKQEAPQYSGDISACFATEDELQRRGLNMQYANPGIDLTKLTGVIRINGTK